MQHANNFNLINSTFSHTGLNCTELSHLLWEGGYGGVKLKLLLDETLWANINCNNYSVTQYRSQLAPGLSVHWRLDWQECSITCNKATQI